MTRRPLSTDDLRAAARARLPRFIFDFIDGGAGDEAAVRRNRAAFAGVTLTPHVLDLPAPPTIATSLWGERFAAPFGIAPMGLGELAWPGTDRAMARAAAAAGVPLGVSMMTSSDIADLARIAGDRAWLQVYHGLGDGIADALLARAGDAGVTTLILTVDANFPALRLRDRRNGFPQVLRQPAGLAGLLRHPRWTIATARAGPPRPVHLAATGSDDAPGLADLLAQMARAPLEWSVVGRLRDQWRGRLLIKGILAAADAIEARRRGADGVIVSNHGGRQFAGAVASLAALPAIRAAVGDDFPLLIDGGVRSGEDVAKALALGADIALIGRPFLFAAAAMGPDEGPAHLLAMLLDETLGALAQLGRRTPADVRAQASARDRAGIAMAWRGELVYTDITAEYTGDMR